MACQPQSLKRVVMGINRKTQKPCGFCFLEFATRTAAQQVMACGEACQLQGKEMKCDWDYGFRYGRQFGRGRSGGQVQDEKPTSRSGSKEGMEVEFGSEAALEGGLQRRNNKRTFRERDSESTSKGADEQQQSLKRTVKDETTHGSGSMTMTTAAEIKAETTTPGW